MTRRRRDEVFRLEQEQGRYASHVRPINEMVDALRDQDGRGWMPQVAPWRGGVEARALSILRGCRTESVSRHSPAQRAPGS